MRDLTPRPPSPPPSPGVPGEGGCGAPVGARDTTGGVADASFTIDKVYPWGRSLDEYRRMFVLSDADLSSISLAVADGPASFNAELARRGGHVTSCDPLYRFDGG